MYHVLHIEILNFHSFCLYFEKNKHVLYMLIIFKFPKLTFLCHKENFMNSVVLIECSVGDVGEIEFCRGD